MSRILLTLALLIAGGFAMTFLVSHEVERKEAALAEINNSIRAERDRYRVLRAEWASLNDPARLEETLRQAQKLSPALLLSPTTGEQFLTSLTVIPARILPGTPMPDMRLPVSRPFNRRPAAEASIALASANRTGF